MKAFDSKINDETSKTSSMKLSTGVATALFVLVACGLAGIQFYAVYNRYIELSNRIADLENSVKDLKGRVQELEAVETGPRQDSASRQSKDINVYQRRRRSVSDTESQAI
ncbi:uncharacterized protein LOC117117319, partial [Anneissia japonica]|uniref:uncharacterized protein LOC117117319 n=1 Tax=Anneissia japonica TaxID=1529436 RepID=UPI001425A85D